MEKLDGLDSKLLQMLKEDARVSIPAAAKRLGVPAQTAYFRFNRLVKRGVVAGFTTRLGSGAGRLRAAVVEPRDFRVAGMNETVVKYLAHQLAKRPDVVCAARQGNAVFLVWRGDFDPSKLDKVRKVKEIRLDGELV
jgi:DNA-binding Lrp family transcriptional regulator